MNDLKELYFKDRDAIFRRLEEIASRANLSKEEYDQYRYEWKINNDYFNCLDYAIEQGREQGLVQGREQGLEQGREQGKQEVAKNLKAMGLSSDNIMKATGLSIEEIEKL